MDEREFLERGSTVRQLARRCNGLEQALRRIAQQNHAINHVDRRLEERFVVLEFMKCSKPTCMEARNAIDGG